MKKFLLGTMGLVAMVGSAVAADLPARTYKAPPPMVAAIYDWTGFYIGGNGGWGSSRDCWGLVPVAGTVLPDGCLSASGGVIGGQILAVFLTSDTIGNTGLPAESAYTTMFWLCSAAAGLAAVLGVVFLGPGRRRRAPAPRPAEPVAAGVAE